MLNLVLYALTSTTNYHLDNGKKHLTHVVIHLSFLQNIQLDLWFYVSTERPVLVGFLLKKDDGTDQLVYYQLEVIKYVSPKSFFFFFGLCK